MLEVVTALQYCEGRQLERLEADQAGAGLCQRC